MESSGKEYSHVLPDKHMVILYNDKQDTTEILVSYIKENLEKNIKCLFITGDVETEEIMHSLAVLIDVQEYIKKEQFYILDKEDIYSKDGDFIAEKMISHLIKETEKALAAGFDGLAVTGEVSWALNYDSGFEKIMEYEWKLNDRLFSQYPVSSICRYNLEKFNDDMIINIIQVHPYVIWEDKVHANPFYISSEGYKNNDIKKYQVKSWLENISKFTSAKSGFISEIQKKEIALIESEEKYKYIFDNSPIGKSVTFIKGEMNVNNTFCKMLGYTKNELEGELWASITYPDDLEISQRAVETLLSGKKETLGFEKRYIKKDGSILWADVRVSLRKNSKEEPMYFFTSIIDITARKLAENERNMANEKFETLYEEAPLAYQSLDENGNFISVNKAWIELFGYKKDELIGNSFSDFIVLRERDVFKSNFETLKKTGKNQFIYNMVKKSGETISVKYIGKVVKNKENAFGHTLSILNDITESLKAETKLIKQEEEQRILLERLKIGIIVLTKEGNIVFCNRTAQKIVECEESELIGKTPAAVPWEFVSLEEKKIDVREYPASIVLREKRDLNNYVVGIKIRKSEKVKWLNTCGHILNDGDGEPQRIVMSFSDITEIKIAEQEKKNREAQLRNQQKLESIGTLASGVAHEINNPLNGILNYGQIILDLEPDENIENYAKEIIHETSRVSEIVKNLLDFSRHNKQQHSYAIMTDIIHHTISLINNVIKRDQIDFEIEIEQNLPKIKCRSQQIQQVILNLLTNALDALNEKYKGYSTEKILVLKCESFENENRKWIRIIVEDRGMGISDENIDKIFDPFFTTKGKDKGTGLGLSISYGIIKEHHGDIKIETEKNKYTRVIVELPADNGWELNS